MSFLGFGSNNDYQEGLDQEAANTLKGTAVPDIDSMKLQLQQLVQQGQITPEDAQTYLEGQSDYNNISLDPKFKNAQLDALSSLQNIGQNNGVTAQDQAQLNDIQTQEDTKTKGARDAILQHAQERGVSGSGLEMLDQLTNAQDSATRASTEGFNVAANAQQRALQALQSAGTLGSTLQNNEFNEKAQVAGANDAISRFNTQNQQTVENANVAANNKAQEENLANKQSIANSNVDIANKEQQYNNELPQQNFNNNLTKNTAVANSLNKGGANVTAANTAQDQVQAGLIGAGVTGAAKAFSDKSLKENVKEFNPSEFLDNLTSYKYNYKNPEHGNGKQVGVMAQDLEKGAPQMVEDTPEGKVVDYSKAGAPLFASLAHLHQRLKKIEGK